MTTAAFIIRHVCFTGPDKPQALITFGHGLNVLYGASETGKSFVLEAIDFMLGGRGPLRDIPERVGYDRIFLGIVTSGNDTFTFVRATSGGQFQVYEGLHQSVPAEMEATVLGARHSADNDNNLSSFLLHKIGLKGKRLRTNARGDTRSLSFRDVCRLCLVTEGDIQKQGSPIESGQPVQKTPEYATFKLLLTGVDDSAVVSTSRDTALSQSRIAKIEFIDELLASYRERTADSEDEQQELMEQLERLEAAIARDQQALRVSEENYQKLANRRNDLRRRYQNGVERRSEIDALMARFSLLDGHYKSDLARLGGISEAGSLLAALSPEMCPLCGAEPEHQHREGDCDGNLEAIIAASHAESAKIIRLRRELEETIRQLEHEAQSFDRLIPKMHDDLRKLDQEMQAIGPGLVERRATYTDLVEKRASVRTSLSLFDQVADLETRREEFAKASEGEGTQTQVTTDLSSTTIDQFAQQVEQLLAAWNFPEAERVYFDQADRDLVINGKRRSSRGKGMRAITHAAFIVGLLEFCRAQSKPHPGFVVLDSPLLAYREPEGTEDDLRGTDVQDKLYEYLGRLTDRQVIIIENVDPPPTIAHLPNSIFFSKNPHQGRYGFFPITVQNSTDDIELSSFS